MSDKPFKAFERHCAALISGRRYWSNSGATIDVEGETIVAQCKIVQKMSLQELTALALQAEQDGRRTKKHGTVFVKLRSGKGVVTPTLVVMTEATFRAMFPGVEHEIRADHL